MAKGGRPTKLTPELQEQLLEALRRTWYLETAADLAGIPRQTVYQWVKKGRQTPGSAYGRFRDAIRKVLAEKNADTLKVIADASEENWTAAAWLMERRNPDQWGRKERREITGPKGGPLQVEIVEELTDATPADSEAHSPPPGPASLPPE